jgi:uncharacterized membrane protein AbrB (regulator of aidB expression)
MSLGARWLLGGFAVILGLMFLYSAQVESVKWECYVSAGFCGVIAAACFSSQARSSAVRIIGAFVFAISSLFVATGGAVVLHWARALPGVTGAHLATAPEGFVFLGLPGLYVALKGKYPRWGIQPKVFRGELSRSQERDASPEA